MAKPARRQKEPRAGTERPASEPSSPPPSPPQGAEIGSRLGRRGTWVLLGVLLLINVPVLHRFLLRGEAAVTTRIPYQQDFDAPLDLRQDWFSTGGLWRVEDGALLSPGVKNNPLWLQARLPDDVLITFDVRAQLSEGDVKVELFGDGTDHASGYVLIHGGWNNSRSIIARLDEHGRNVTPADRASLTPSSRVRVEERGSRVQAGRTYRWRIERKGGRISWSIDGRPHMTFDDPYPLRGPGHDRFGFSSWMNDLRFDNLSITPL